MKKQFSYSLLALLICSICNANDLGFRLHDRKCVNAQGQSGLNPGYVGQCGDLSNTVASRFNFDEYDLSGSVFDNADLRGSSLRKANLTSTSFQSANLSGVDMADAVLVDVDLCAADLSGTRLSYVKFTRTSFSSAIFRNAVLDHADFSDADLSHVLFIGTNLRNANLTGANGENTVFRRARLDGANLDRVHLQKSDMRGANLTGASTTDAKLNDSFYDKRSVLPFSNDVAANMGMIFKNGGRLLIIWEKHVPFLDGLVDFLMKEGVEVHLSAKSFDFFDGTESLADYSTVLFLGGENFALDMPAGGQEALVEFVRSGGTFAATQWAGYMFARIGKLQKMREIIVFDYEKGIFQETELTPVAAQISHPILDGISGTMKYTTAYDNGHPHFFAQNPSTALLMNKEGFEVVAVRNFGDGRAVGFNFSGTYNNCQALDQPIVKKIILNTSNW